EEDDDATTGDDTGADAGFERGDAPVVDASDAASEASDAGSDAHDAGDASDASDAADAADALDAADANDGDPCDKHRDTYRAKGGTCGGLDCDDNDSRRNPGVSMFLTYPTSDGDWNCDLTVDRQYTSNVVCNQILLTNNCNNAAGFSGADPGCGQQGNY